MVAWLVSLREAPTAAALAGLDDDERQRAARLVGADVRRRFLSARVAQRDLLARTLGEDPAALRFAHEPLGRPSLAAPPAPDLDFNLSHKGDHMIIAIARGARVGVDIEQIDPARDGLRIARRFLHPDDVARIEAHAPNDRPAAFTRAWTRAEAWVKLHGGSIARGAPAMLPAEAADATRLDDVTVARLSLPLSGFEAALAVGPPDGGRP